MKISVTLYEDLIRISMSLISTSDTPYSDRRTSTMQRERIIRISTARQVTGRRHILRHKYCL